jgi:DNA helicase-2/ATP-dependent DNA helicase PcrA
VTVRPASLDASPIRYGAYENASAEVAAVAADIANRRLSPDRTVVLARTTKLLESAARAMQEKGLDTFVAVRKSQFQDPAIRVLMHSLRLANGRHDHDVLRRLCVAWNALTGATLEVAQVEGSAELVGGDYLRAWANSASTTDPLQQELLAHIKASLVERLEYIQVVEWFLEQARRTLATDHDLLLEEEVSTWDEIHADILREYGADRATLNVYLQCIDLAPKGPRPTQNQIRLLTVHGSKGLEFDHVYVIGMAQEVFPSFQALKQGPYSRELEEERRNCFVAITRTLETLTLTRAHNYSGWAKQPSQFLQEMGIDAK